MSQDIKPDIATAALAVACRVQHVDVDGKPFEPDYTGGAGLVRKTAGALEVLAAAIVEAAVQASTINAMRVLECSKCRHLQEERSGFLHEIEGLRLELAAVKAQFAHERAKEEKLNALRAETQCVCGGSRQADVLTADLVPAGQPCACAAGGVHTACVGHCPESADRSRARRSRTP